MNNIRRLVQKTIKARKVMTEVPLVQEQQANGVLKTIVP